MRSSISVTSVDDGLIISASMAIHRLANSAAISWSNRLEEKVKSSSTMTMSGWQSR